MCNHTIYDRNIELLVDRNLETVWVNKPELKRILKTNVTLLDTDVYSFQNLAIPKLKFEINTFLIRKIGEKKGL